MTTIDELLKQQSENIEALFALLTQEASVIASKKSADIEQVAKEKFTLLAEVQEQDNALSKLIQKQNLYPSAKEKIAKIKSLLVQCHQQNNANGIALARVALSMHKLKNLFEESMGTQEMIYDENGKALNSQTLGTNIKA